MHACRSAAGISHIRCKLDVAACPPSDAAVRHLQAWAECIFGRESWQKVEARGQLPK